MTASGAGVAATEATADGQEGTRWLAPASVLVDLGTAAIEVAAVFLPIQLLYPAALRPTSLRLWAVLAVLLAAAGTLWSLLMGQASAGIRAGAAAALLGAERRSGGQAVAARIAAGYRTALGLPGRSLWLRTALLTVVAALWGGCGVVAFHLPAEGLLWAVWSAALLTPHIDAWRAQWVLGRCDGLLRTLLGNQAGEAAGVPLELRLLRDTLGDRLMLTALSISGLFGAAAIYLLSTALALPGRGVLALWWWGPPALLGASLAWLLWLRRRVRGIVAFVDQDLAAAGQRSAGQATPALARSLLRALRSAQRLPYTLALAVWLAWTGATVVALLAAQPRFALPPPGLLQVALPAALLMFAAALYQVPYHQATLAPLWPRLTARSPRALRGRAPLSLPLLLGLTVAVLMTLWEALLGSSGVAPSGRALAASGVLILVAVGGAVCVLRDVLRPLRALRRRAGWLSAIATSAGSEQEPAAAATRRDLDAEGDEVGLLAAAFVAMQRALGERLLSSAQAQLLLEHQVSARTLELQRRNDELQRALADIERAQKALLHTEHLASVGRLVAGIAHEINNPINAVVNTAAPLREALAELAEPVPAESRSQLLAEVAEMQRVLTRGIRRTQQIVRALHSYASPPPALRTAVDLQAVVTEAVELVQHPDKAGVRVRCPPTPLPAVSGDAGQLVQVFVNLLSNALHAARSRAAEADRDVRPQVEVALSVAGEGVVAAVRDNGPGIPAAVRQRIFEPFFTTKDASSGSGLGLSIAHSIVSRHGGTIAVAAADGEGACFRVTLPLAAPGAS